MVKLYKTTLEGSQTDVDTASSTVRAIPLALGVLPRALGLPALCKAAHEGGERLSLLERDARVQRGAQPRTVAERRQRAEAHLATVERRGSELSGWVGESGVRGARTAETAEGCVL